MAGGTPPFTTFVVKTIFHNHDPTADVVHQRGRGHQHDEQRIGPAVEEVAEDGQQQVSSSSGGSVIEQQRQRQEVEDEQVRAEDHGERPGKRVW